MLHHSISLTIIGKKVQILSFTVAKLLYCTLICLPAAIAALVNVPVAVHTLEIKLSI